MKNLFFSILILLTLSTQIAWGQVANDNTALEMTKEMLTIFADYVSSPSDVKNKINSANSINTLKGLDYPNLITEDVKKALDSKDLDKIKKSMQSIYTGVPKAKEYKDSIDKKLEEIYTKYNNQLNNSPQNSQSNPADSATTTRPDSDSVNSGTSESGTENKDMYSTLPKLGIDAEAVSWILIGVAVLSILNLLFWLGLHGSVRSLRKKVATRSSSSDIKGEMQSLQSRIGTLEGSLKNEIQSLKKDIESLSHKIANLEQKASQNAVENQGTATHNPTEKPEAHTTDTRQSIGSVPTQEAYYEVLYAKNLDRTNGFSSSSIQKENNKDSIYKIFLLNKNLGEITLNIENLDAKKKAMTDTKAYLRACESVNDPIEKLNVRVLEKGSVVLQNDIWVVTKKVKIEYI
ncbi:hypothetical protein [Hugenholtzia roseola]|uniref:hypothetical protein n=1 Tax=Hugenholtzia roseola TaxID=1002 RepID=UPI0004171140|nr:hypothetical protein [Hugenholtzia roseola]